MNLAVSNIAWDEKNDDNVYRLMKEYGFTGLEIAPTRIFPVNPYENMEGARTWKEQIQRVYGFVIPSMQSIWYGRQEKIFGKQEERDRLLAYTKQAIDFASEIVCSNLVFGCPQNRTVQEGGNTKAAIPFFQEMAEYAKQKGCVIGFEANPEIYHTNYMNDTESVLRLIGKIKSDGFLLNLDVGTMIENNEDIGMLEGKVSLIHHVHISEPNLKTIQKRELHKELADLLKRENYQGFVSMEMGREGALNVIQKAMSYIREVFG